MIDLKMAMRYARTKQKMLNIEKIKLPEGAKEGDVLIIQRDKIVIDHDETKRRKKRIKKIMDALWE